jgi:Domain of unknown function (DUF4405)
VVKKSFLLRLLFDGLAAGLMVAGLAYYGLGNTAHEWIGTAMFALVLAHNLFNRRWWGNLAKPARERRGWFDRVWTLLLLVGMAALVLTSISISQSVFAFMQWGGGFTARQIHALAAYWVVVLVAVHLGVRWKRVMLAVRSALKLTEASAVRTVALRLSAAVIAAYGVKSTFVMGLGGRLAMQMSLDGWDFEASTAAFFTHWISIIGLYVVLTHYTLAWIQNIQGRAATHTHPSHENT